MTDLQKAAERALNLIEVYSPDYMHGESKKTHVKRLRHALAESANSTTSVMESEIKRLQELAATTSNLVTEIERLQELADYRLKLLTKMPSEWVGLTDEEIDHIWGITPPDYVDKFALPRTIEAKLKEKNCAQPNQMP